MRAAALAALLACTKAPTLLGGEHGLDHVGIAVRDLAARLGSRLGKEPVIVGTEQPTAWLTDTSQATKLFGLPVVDTGRLIRWTADWVKRAMPSLGKPTKYEVRDGRY